MESGALVSDDIVVGIINDRIEEPDAKSGFILDGFPRTLAQAGRSTRCSPRKGLKLDAAIELTVDAPKLVERIVRRAAGSKAPPGAGAQGRRSGSVQVASRRLSSATPPR